MTTKHCLTIMLMLFSVLHTPASFSKDEKATVSAKLYKKLKKTEKLIENSDYRGAIKSLKAMHLDVKKGGFEEATVLRSLSSVYALQEDYAKAADALANCLQIKALPAAQVQPALLNLGQLYMATEKYQLAIKTLENWLAANQKSDAQIHIMLAKAHAQLKQYRQGIPYVEKAIKSSSKPVESWYKLALAFYFETKNYAKAAGVLKKLIRYYPAQLQYWNQLASVYQEDNQYVKATTIKHLGYKKGILASEREILNLVNLFLFIDSPYKAAKILTQELNNKRIQHSSKNWELLANAWTQAREFDHAIAALTTASQLNSQGQLFQRMGNIHVEQEQWSQAVKAFNKALQKGSLKKIGNTYLMLGISYYEQKKLAKARSSFSLAKNYKASSKPARQWLVYIGNPQIVNQ